MRKIRFRAWDSYHKKMLDDASRVGNVLHWNGGLCFTAITDFDADPPRHILMQDTGLHDKNGKEIYEGDILRDENGTAAAEWAPGMGSWGIPDPDGCMTLLADCDEGMEIIGNIYENPELLGQQDHTDCCCFQCAGMVDAASNPDCACETGPVYSRDVCKACPKASFCDVPKNPQDYPHDDDCQCFKCREYNAEAVRP
jgi:hypothetical protein